MNSSGATAQTPEIVDLSQRRTDILNLKKISGFKYVKIDRIRAEIRLATSDSITDDWAKTLRVSVTHIQSGEVSRVSPGSARVLISSSVGTTIELRPFPPPLGLKSLESRWLKVVITTASDLKKTLMAVTSSGSRESGLRRKTRRSAEVVRRTETGTDNVLPFRPRN
jgi:hypothetical protein